MTLTRRVIDWLKPEPMTATEICDMGWKWAIFAALAVGFGALCFGSLALVLVLGTDLGGNPSDTIYSVVVFGLASVQIAGATASMFLLSTVCAIWRSHQERKAKPDAGTIKEVCDGIVARFPEAK